GGEQALRAVAEGAAARWPRKGRVVLQVDEGLAIAGPVAASDALQAARRAGAHPQAGVLGLALHHGPLRAIPAPQPVVPAPHSVVPAPNSVVPAQAGTQSAASPSRVDGEGLTTAAVLAGLARDRMLVSGAFRAALAAEAPRRAQDLQPVPELSGPGGTALFRDDTQGARSRGQRRTLLAAGGMLALLGAGWAGRAAREAYEAAHRPAVILLEIRPAGEVFVDGVRQGTSPPLTRLQVEAGPHTIEIRSARAKPLRLEVLLKPGQELPLQHVFAPPPAPRRAAPAKPRPKAEPGPFERFKFW
ncbi:MAG TPA: hypothetical protein VFM98_15775, partial [Ramlibacter sp.]|nr:hypothetical protein [Ramlibacter sp.]